MWIEINRIFLVEHIVYLPREMIHHIKPETFIRFGLKKVWARVKPLTFFGKQGGAQFDHPQQIKMTNTLWDKLRMVDSLRLRMKIVDGEIELGPVIGLLLGNQNYRYDSFHMQKYSDRLGIYPYIGGLIFSFSTQTIDWEEKTVCGLYYNYFERDWKYGEFPLPAVVYRRHFHTKPDDLKRLVQVTDGKVFNSGRFTKWGLYKTLKDDERMKAFIPDTKEVKCFNDVQNFLNKYKKVILKPSHLSRGRGICIVENQAFEKSDHTLIQYCFAEKLRLFSRIKEQKAFCKICDYRLSKDNKNILLNLKQFKKFIEDNFLDSPYLVQPLLPLAQVNGGPFDVRIVMQKDVDGCWVHSGTECRIAQAGALITNISRGGYALSVKDSLESAFGTDLDYQEAEKEMLKVCHHFCQVMDETGEHYAEFGIDVAIDMDKNVWFIEANVFPSFKGFKKMDYNTYLLIRYRPLLYAAQLAGFEGKEYDFEH